jgi:hypothetical protein
MSPANIQLIASSRFRALEAGILLLVLLSLGFGMGWRMSRSRAESVSKFCLAHLDYVLQTKDDMGLVDWAHTLEKTEDALAYDIQLGGKSRISGGNQALLPQNPPQGIRYYFPSQWCVTWGSPTRGAEATLVFEAHPSPWKVGLVFGSIAVMSFLGTLLLFFNEKIPKLLPAPSARTRAETSQFLSSSKMTARTASGNLPTDQPFLMVSRDLEILDSSPSIQRVFPFFDPTTSIFFDLLPAKELSDLIQNGAEGRIEGAFGTIPDLGVSVVPQPDGSLLVFETSKERRDR